MHYFLHPKTRTAWYQNLHKDQKIQLASAASVGSIQFNIPPEPGQAPTEADLATTPEVTQSSAIKAKAAELGNNPVAIHNWVRNHIDWVSTWSAMQSAQDTLDKQRGNALDTASLEIALLRASSIPARYQIGTIVFFDALCFEIREDMFWTLLRYVASYKNQLLQIILQSKTPIQGMKQW